jgi:outer membrane lipoprotein-sorting protein
MTENSKLIDHYDAKVTGSEKINNRECLILELTAKVEDISYYSRKVWVDKERWVPLKEERYSKSGKPLKRVEMKEVMNIGGRWYPKRILYKDLLQTGDGTEYLIESINLNVNIPASQFTKAALKK